ncbi:hypothetical protein C8R43DRAFT_1107847 [Mycena crocata]|nr:hypothetical protein C8R43DRAFT_1107847 [Mycena crocata]
MSARQPFVPGSGFGASSRPESRSATSNAPSIPHFVADPTNPLNGGSTTPKDRADNVDNRPLNIGSLTKNNRMHPPPPPRRQSMQTTGYPRPSTSDPHSIVALNHPTRPGTSDPHSKPQSMAVPNHRLQSHAGIVAPTPVQARSTSAIFSNPAPAFKTPTLPAPRTRTPANDTMHDQQSLSPEHSRDENVPNNGAFRLKTLPTQPGAHRLNFGAARAVTDLTEEEDEIYEITESEAAVRGRNKRGRSEVDDDEHEHGYGGQAKRFKGQQQLDEAEAYPRTADMYHRSSSPHENQEYAQQPRRPAPAAPPHQHPPAETNRLLHLLKADGFDLQCDARVEKYTRLAEKWKTCSREEWMAGADGLATNYNKIFDFVKSHMATKLQLFATCDGRLQQQNEVLKDREAQLGDVKEGLVAESGNVLKGAAH